MEMNDKLKDAYEKLLQKVNKKKRHVGIGSHDVWRDPHVEKLKEELNYTEDELARLKQELERMKKQREVCEIKMKRKHLQLMLYCLFVLWHISSKLHHL